MSSPASFRYSKDHEWASADGAVVRIGITNYAQDALGDVVFVDVSMLGKAVAVGGVVGEVESTKSVSEIYAPVGGTVTAVNDALKDAPELVNQDPYGAGWICEITVADASDFESLLDAAAYDALTSH
jgi:glycine cleavage system H protein